MANDRRLTDQQFNSLIARKSMKQKTYGKTKPRQERIVDIRNVLNPDIWGTQAPKIALGGT